MKLISAKNLLASLLGIGYVIYKVMTFDELFDLYWICFIGFLSIKGLIAAFSQKAYDKDIQTATQKQDRGDARMWSARGFQNQAENGGIIVLSGICSAHAHTRHDCGCYLRYRFG